MDASQQQINTWQGWFELLKSVYSTDGWLGFLAYTREDNATADDDTVLARVYTIPIQINLNVTLLLACLQTPPDQVDTVLTSISKHIASIRFEKTPRKLKRSDRELYRQTVEIVTRMIPITCEVISQILKVYVSDAYDPAADANAIMREAQAFSAARDRTKALNAIARAGAAGLRGARIWTGWGMEGTDEFCNWGLAVITMVAALHDALPLESYAQQRQKMDELIARLQPPDETLELDDNTDAMNDRLNDVMDRDLQSLTDDIFAIAGRTAPLSDDEIRAMGDKYEMVGEFALRCIELYDASEDENLDLNSLRMVGITCLGILRYTRSMAIDRLIHLIVADQDNDEEEWGDEAVIALENIGAPALPAVFDYVRYTSLEDARDLLLEVLAVIGRGNQEVNDYLLQNFTETAWSGDRGVYTRPLALLHDQSTVPLFVAALREPGLRDADAWALLDALQELSVTFFVNHDQSAVDIPGYGVIEGVLPVDWQSRQEMDEEVSEWEEEWEEGDDDVLDDEDKDDDINDEDQLDDEVVYDKNGTPHCPDCGAEMHYVDGAWVHEEDLVEPKSIKPQIKPVGRNDPCPCGSGKKYKYCHGRDA